MDYPSGGLVLVILILFSAFFSGSETALTAVSAGKVRSMLAKNVRGSRYVQFLKNNPIELLVTILLGNNAVNIGASAYATVIFTEIFASKGVGIATGVMTFFILIFGEIVPKAFANRHIWPCARIAGPILYYLRLLFYPVVKILAYFVRSFMKKTKDEESVTITEDELKAMVSIGAEEGAINRREQEMIENILEFNDTKASDVMTPRVRVDGMDEEMSIEQALDFAMKSGHTRYPVFKENLDNITSSVSIKNLLQFRSQNSGTKKLKDLPLKAMFMIPHFKKIHTLFREFQKSRQHMAVVLDEHGGTSGIVTLEDLLEEIVGDIVDEHEIDPGYIEKIKAKEFLVSGETTIEDVAEELNIDLPEAYYRSINYLILKTLSRFPHRDEVIDFPQCSMKVVQKNKKRIEKVLIVLK